MNMAIMSDVVMELLKRDVPLTGHGFSLVLLSIIMPLVCLILTLNRVWWRSWIGRTFGKDDGLIIISMVSSFASACLSLLRPRFRALLS